MGCTPSKKTSQPEAKQESVVVQAGSGVVHPQQSGEARNTADVEKQQDVVVEAPKSAPSAEQPKEEAAETKEEEKTSKPEETAKPEEGKLETQKEVNEEATKDAPVAAVGEKDEAAAAAAAAEVAAETVVSAVADPEGFVKANPTGLYLKYDAKDNGTFVGVWSKEPVEGAFAFARPSSFVNIPEYKFKRAEKIQDKVNMGKAMFFQAWCQYIKEAKNLNSTLVLLPPHQAEQFTPIQIYFHSGPKVDKFTLASSPINLKLVECVVVVSPSYDGFNEKEKSGCNRPDFLRIAKSASDNAYIEFGDK